MEEKVEEKVEDTSTLAQEVEEISSDDEHGNFEGDLKFKDNM